MNSFSASVSSFFSFHAVFLQLLYSLGLVDNYLKLLVEIAEELCVSIDELCGLQQSGTVSLIGLTDGQADCVRLLIDAFHEYNNTVRKRLSDEQYRVLGQILAEFLK